MFWWPGIRPWLKSQLWLESWSLCHSPPHTLKQMNAERPGSSLGLLFQSWASGFHCQDAFWLAFNKKAWKELQLKFVNKTDKMTSLSLPPPHLSFYSAWETSSWQCFREVRSPCYYCPSAWFPGLFCLEHIGLTHGSCQICCLAICKTAHLLTKQGHKYPIYLWRKVVCFVLFCFVVMIYTEPGCFRSCSWCLWKALHEEGCMGLVPWRLDLRCKSSWILNEFFTKN